MLFEEVLQVLEAYNYYRQVIKRLLDCRLGQDLVGHEARHLVDRVLLPGVLNLLRAQLVYCVPGDVQNVLVRQTVKNAVTPQDDEIVELWPQSEL